MKIVENENLIKQYSGNKDLLRSLYDELITNIKQFGKDIEFDIKIDQVSLVHKTEFAVIRPTTNSTIEILMKMPDVEYTERLVMPNKNDADKFSHLVLISTSDDIDYELYNWLKSSYERMKYPLFSN